MTKTKPTNGLSAKERAKDEAEAKRIRTELRKKYQPSFKTVSPSIRKNSASGKYEIVKAFFWGSYDTLAKAEAALKKFVGQVERLRAA